MIRTVQLPQPRLTGPMPLEEVIVRRRSVRAFSTRELTMEQVSQLLWAGQGITDIKTGFRTVPSAGALFPLSLYVLKKDGFYLYLPLHHELQSLSGEDKRPTLARTAVAQSAIREAPLVIVIASNRTITEARYGPRSARYISLEVGHAAQNIHLQAVALGLVSVPIAAFYDEQVIRTLELPDQQEPLYIIPVGHPAATVRL